MIIHSYPTVSTHFFSKTLVCLTKNYTLCVFNYEHILNEYYAAKVIRCKRIKAHSCSGLLLSHSHLKQRLENFFSIVMNLGWSCNTENSWKIADLLIRDDEAVNY